jgi:hypothetical protein
MTTAAESVSSRALAIAFALCGLATVLLLTNHPASAAHDFAGVLREEAGNKLADGIVHGGFIFVLAALITCFALLARRLGPAKTAVVVTTVAFSIGSAALMFSMLVDGLVIPAVAARYLDVTAPEQIAAAKALFVFSGTAISFLMPLGIAFQAIAMLSLGGMFASTAAHRGTGISGVALGVLVLLLPAGTLAGLPPHLLLVGIALTAAWYFLLAVLLWRGLTVADGGGDPARP